MKLGRGNLFAVLVFVVVLAVPAFPQGATNGTITGRAEDISGALIPGVEVTVSSSVMIQGSRTAITNETGSYRFTQLPGGDYTVSFSLPGFATLNIEGVTVRVGATATVNGAMEVATVAETITVTSQEPTIDLEQATVAVNFSDKEFEDVPYSRSLRGIMMMIPGVFATRFDVGGSSFGTGSSSGGQAFGKSGDAQVVIDGMVWDQHYEDFGSFDEVQVTTAAKSAEQSNPGTSLSFVIKVEATNSTARRRPTGPTSASCRRTSTRICSTGASPRVRTPSHATTTSSGTSADRSSGIGRGSCSPIGTATAGG